MCVHSYPLIPTSRANKHVPPRPYVPRAVRVVSRQSPSTAPSRTKCPSRACFLAGRIHQLLRDVLRRTPSHLNVPIFMEPDDAHEHLAQPLPRRSPVRIPTAISTLKSFAQSLNIPHA